MTGKLSITADRADNQLEIVVEDENGNYQKHFIGLSDNVTYTVEQKKYKEFEKQIGDKEYILAVCLAKYFKVPVESAKRRMIEELKLFRVHKSTNLYHFCYGEYKLLDEKCRSCINEYPGIDCLNCGSKHYNYVSDFD